MAFHRASRATGGLHPPIYLIEIGPWIGPCRVWESRASFCEIWSRHSGGSSRCVVRSWPGGGSAARALWYGVCRRICTCL